MAVFHRIRILSPLGRYPRNSLATAGARLVSHDDLVFTIVEVRPPIEHGIDHNQDSELEVLALEEIRFLAAVTMAVHWDRGMVYPYFLPFCLDVQQLPAEDVALFEMASAHARRPIIRPFTDKGDVLPPVAGGPMYDREMLVDEALTTELVRCTSLSDHLLMRGLGALLRAEMIWAGRELAEAAAMMLYVAMEASFQLFRRILQAKGNPDPSAADAGAYLDEMFGHTAESGGYFPDFYRDRIRVMHPASRYGTFAYAPLDASDYYWLRRSLVKVFGFRITGRVW